MRNPLNDNDISGNTMAYISQESRENTSSHEDTYSCSNCGDIISTNQHDEHQGLCPDCEENDIMGMKFGGI